MKVWLRSVTIVFVCWLLSGCGPSRNYFQETGLTFPVSSPIERANLSDEFASQFYSTSLSKAQIATFVADYNAKSPMPGSYGPPDKMRRKDYEIFTLFERAQFFPAYSPSHTGSHFGIKNAKDRFSCDHVLTPDTKKTGFFKLYLWLINYEAAGS